MYLIIIKTNELLFHNPLWFTLITIQYVNIGFYSNWVVVSVALVVAVVVVALNHNLLEYKTCPQ